MELSLFLAQLFGLTLIITVVSALIRPQLIEGVFAGLKGNSALPLLFGYVAIIGGLAIVLSHNIWVADWPVVITIFGWGAIAKGVMFMATPALLVSMGSTIYGAPNRTKLIMVLALVLGIYLTAKGFGY